MCFLGPYCTLNTTKFDVVIEDNRVTAAMSSVLPTLFCRGIIYSASWTLLMSSSSGCWSYSLELLPRNKVRTTEIPSRDLLSYTLRGSSRGVPEQSDLAEYS